MKKLAQRILPTPVVHEMQRLKRELVDRHAVKSYAQEGEDLILRRVFADSAAGFYVDVGACHPRRFSNTFWFYQNGWRGINIEPNPEAISLFARYRPHDINIAAGVSDEAGTLRYYMFNEPALNSFDWELSKTRESPKYRIEKIIQVPVRRLADILEEHVPKGTHIDFLSVDVEGFDLKVLRSNDWVVYRPGCVLVEAHGVYLDSLNACPAHVFLAKQGYGLFAKTANTLFYCERS